jgi:hypothetical protein
VLALIHTLKNGIRLVEAKRMFYQGSKESGDWIFLIGPFLHGIGVFSFELPKFDHPIEGKGYLPILITDMVLAYANIGLYSRQGCGIRYEDTFVVHRDGVIILTQDEPG